VRRLVGEHTRPAALAAVGVPVDDVAAHSGLERHADELAVEQVVARVPPLPDPLGEHPERVLDRRVDVGLDADGGEGCLGRGQVSS
jgi:hypothetical protein